MRTLTYTKNVYTFAELSEEAQYNAISKYSFLDSTDFEHTLNEFSKIFNINVYRYDVDEYNYSYHFSIKNNTYVEECNGIRLAKWLWNNIYQDISKGKYYSTPGKAIDGKYYFKSRRSNATREINCPLTGFVYDMDILDPVIDALHYKKIYNEYEDLIRNCLNNFFEAWSKDIEWSLSSECFEETADANNWEFDEIGNLA